MGTFLTVIILIIAFLLGAVILVQNPKGGGLAAGFTAALLLAFLLGTLLSNQLFPVIKTKIYLVHLLNYVEFVSYCSPV